MAVRQYIGARYIPRFLGNYSATTVYDALDVVDDGYGTSYIAKKTVPAGTSLNDTIYWALYGSTSGAVIQLQNDINDIHGIVCTPEMFGAAGDGITDDTSALQQAVTNGMTVYLTGDYLISDTINMKNGSMLIGNGKIIIDAAATTLGLSLEDNNIIEGITITDINENNYLATGNAIKASEKKNIQINSCYFEEIHLGYALEFEHCSNFEACNNYFNGYAYAALMASLSCENFKFNHNTVLNGKWTGNNNRYPICVSGFALTNYGPARGIECNYNYIEDTAPLWEGIDSHGCADAEFIGNIIENIPYAIVLGDPTNAGNILPYNMRNITVKDNIIHNNTAATGYSSGISIIPGNGIVASDIIIENNYIETIGSQGSYTDSTAAIGLRARSNGNNFENVSIRNNNIIGNWSGIVIQSRDVAPLTNIHIADNIITGGETEEKLRFNNMLASEYRNVIIENNIIKNHNGYTMVCPLTYAGVGLIKYRDNWGTANFARDTYATTPKSAIPADLSSKGYRGDFIPSTNAGEIGWYCKSAGTWLLVTGS